MRASEASNIQIPQVPDHVLYRAVGKGACGEVWLAKNLLGSYRAIKVTYRETFSEERPFLREFEGVQKFEPISRTHPGLVPILHVGKNVTAEYFYSVMEVADDVRNGRDIDEQAYVPRTLRKEIAERGRLPAQEVLEIGLALSSALSYLHAEGLIHRDIKPSNIIFINHRPRLADIGLVTGVGEQVTAVGTPGYMPPEGPGGAPGDIYSLGKVLYELFTGKPCSHFPELPLPLSHFVSDPLMVQLNNIVLKACHTETKQRFQNAAELHQALLEAAGFPPDASAARDLGSSVVRPKSVASANRSGVEAPKPSRPLVCFIDDDEEELEIFREVFEGDLQVVDGTRFAQVMAKLNQVGRQPDLFVLDLYFPLGRDATTEERETMLRLRSEVETAKRKLSEFLKTIGQDRDGGIHLLEQVRDRFKDVPAVFYTRKGTVEDVAVCLAAGARDVIPKPQPEQMDTGRELYPQLMEAAIAHRSSLLAKFESLSSSRSLFGKLARVIGFVRKNWNQL